MICISDEASQAAEDGEPREAHVPPKALGTPKVKEAHEPKGHDGHDDCRKAAAFRSPPSNFCALESELQRERGGGRAQRVRTHGGGERDLECSHERKKRQSARQEKQGASPLLLVHQSADDRDDAAVRGAVGREEQDEARDERHQIVTGAPVAAISFPRVSITSPSPCASDWPGACGPSSSSPIVQDWNREPAALALS